MILRQFGMILAGLALLAACSTNEPATQSPSSSPSPMGTAQPNDFDIAAQYIVDSTIGGTHKQQTIITIGKPMSLAGYLSQHPCHGLRAYAHDVAIPFSISVMNTSPAVAMPTDISSTQSIAWDTGRFTAGATYVHWHNFTYCNVFYPAKKATGQALVGDRVETWEIFRPATQAGQKASDRGAFLITSAGATVTPPAESVFLRITPLGPAFGPPVVPYVVASLTSLNASRPGGTSKEDSGTNAYYIPLGDTTPCGSFSDPTPTQCGVKLP